MISVDVMRIQLVVVRGSGGCGKWGDRVGGGGGHFPGTRAALSLKMFPRNLLLCPGRLAVDHYKSFVSLKGLSGQDPVLKRALAAATLPGNRPVFFARSSKFYEV